MPLQLRGRPLSNSQSVAPKLPALEAVLAWCDARRNLPLRGVKVLAAQHVLGTTLSLFSAIEACGVVPGDIFVVAKAYSSNADAMALARARGYQLFGGGPMSDDRTPYELELEKGISHAIRGIAFSPNVTPPRSLLLVDDGGLALELLCRDRPEYLERAVGVEQTTRGIRTLTDARLTIPVANIGRCAAKLNVEGPLIAASMADGLLLELERLRAHGVTLRPAVVFVGYGAVGALTAEVLRSLGFDVLIIESSDAGRAQAAMDGFETGELPSAFRGRDIVCGATGRPWLLPDWFDHLEPGACLFNMASSDIEFAAWNIRPFGEPINGDQNLRRFPWTTTYRITGAAGSVWLARGGFPINFTGGVDPIDPHKIQITRGLLLAGALEAMVATKPGLFAPSPEVQRLIVDACGGPRTSETA